MLDRVDLQAGDATWAASIPGLSSVLEATKAALADTKWDEVASRMGCVNLAHSKSTLASLPGRWRQTWRAQSGARWPAECAG